MSICSHQLTEDFLGWKNKSAFSAGASPRILASWELRPTSLPKPYTWIWRTALWQGIGEERGGEEIKGRDGNREEGLDPDKTWKVGAMIDATYPVYSGHKWKHFANAGSWGVLRCGCCVIGNRGLTAPSVETAARNRWRRQLVISTCTVSQKCHHFVSL